ncbi:MAG: hydroxyethylthiazole kinase [Alphaproteobacteria bacterium]|jgi:hydroxyethylthiazole kinase|nr:hydroxyethylthiazole kinase [Alphaproteobacteria bacterium]
MEKINHYIQTLKNNKPLICCLTNIVSVDFICNSLLSINAAPIVSCSEKEIEELIKISKALYINIGTLNEDFILLTKKAIITAKKENIPIILDPVGSGATTLRTNFAREILSMADIVKGNASEIISLQNNIKESLGVESNNSVNEAKNIAVNLAKKYDICVAISGKEDFITNYQENIQLNFGCELMSKITGMGCSLGGIITAFATVSQNYFEATRLAILYYTICAEIAYKKQPSPASFKTQFIDTLYQQPLEQIKEIYYGR